MRRDKLRIAIGIATSGRADILREVVKLIDEQTRQPDTILICPAKPDDALGVSEINANIVILSGPVGSAHQRNSILRQTKTDIVLFLDDDFLMHKEYLKELELLFLEHEDVVVATGVVAADGIRGPGFTLEEGRSLLGKCSIPIKAELRETYGGYGCNMAVRIETARENKLFFDENLPLYAWLEDIDFSRQMAKFGRVVRGTKLCGVHLGTKRSGRSSGLRLGYSQVANPFYLAKKGTVSWSFAMKYVRRQFLANCVRSIVPEPWVDRRGRLKGNILAFFEVITGRATPSRILSFK